MHSHSSLLVLMQYIVLELTREKLTVYYRDCLSSNSLSLGDDLNGMEVKVTYTGTAKSQDITITGIEVQGLGASMSNRLMEVILRLIPPEIHKLIAKQLIPESPPTIANGSIRKSSRLSMTSNKPSAQVPNSGVAIRDAPLTVEKSVMRFNAKNIIALLDIRAPSTDTLQPIRRSLRLSVGKPSSPTVLKRVINEQKSPESGIPMPTSSSNILGTAKKATLLDLPLSSASHLKKTRKSLRLIAAKPVPSPPATQSSGTQAKDTNPKKRKSDSETQPSAKRSKPRIARLLDGLIYSKYLNGTKHQEPTTVEINLSDDGVTGRIILLETGTGREVLNYVLKAVSDIKVSKYFVICSELDETERGSSTLWQLQVKRNVDAAKTLALGIIRLRIKRCGR